MKLRALLLSIALSLCVLSPASAVDPAAAPTPAPLPAAVERPVRVGVAVIVNSVTKIVDQTQSFDLSFDLQLRWNDPTLAFDAIQYGMERQEFALEAATTRLQTMWWPQVNLVNLQDKPTRYENSLVIHADGTVEYVQRYKAAFDARFKLAAFPFDSQILPLKILAARESASQMVLVQGQRDVDASRIAPSASVSGWKLDRIEFTSTLVRGLNGAFYSGIDAEIRVGRRPAVHIPVIFIPFLLIMVAPTVMTLYTRGDVAPRITAWGQSILAMIAFNFTLSVRYPGLGSDTFMSELFTIGFAFQTLMVVLTSTIFNPAMTASLGGEDLCAEITAYLRWFVPLALVGAIVYRVMMLQA